MSGVPIVAVKIEYYCFNHSERAPIATLLDGKDPGFIRSKYERESYLNLAVKTSHSRKLKADQSLSADDVIQGRDKRHKGNKLAPVSETAVGSTDLSKIDESTVKLKKQDAPPIMKFIFQCLNDPKCHSVKWIDPEIGTFRFVNQEEFCHQWNG